MTRKGNLCSRNSYHAQNPLALKVYGGGEGGRGEEETKAAENKDKGYKGGGRTLKLPRPSLEGQQV